MSQNISQETREQAQIIFQDGLSLLQQGKPDEADQFFSEAHKLDPNNVDTLNLLGIRAYQKQDHKSAIDFLSRANLIAPHSAQTLSNLGLVHNALFQYADALPYFTLAIDCDPNIPETHNNHGNTLRGLGKIDEANKAYKRAIALRPNYAEALSNQGVLLLEADKADKAISLFERAIKANPHFATAYNNLGNAFTQIEHYEDAFQCFERALQINPNYLDACLNFGNSLKKCKQYEAAIDCYQHALKIDSNNAKTFYFLGEVYYDLGDCDLAKTYYAKSLELQPRDLDSHVALSIAQIPKVAKSIQEFSDSRITFAQQLQFFQALPEQKIDLALSEKLIARHPFYIAYQDLNNEALLSQFGKICTDLAKPIQERVKIRQDPTKTSSKIRLGIVSSFICDHPVWHAITKGWVSQLDTSQFELYILNTNGIEDKETELAKSKAVSYTNCGTAVMTAAQTIVDLRLDVILYPEIGMDMVSKALACLRLAPVQAASWGHPETTGLPTIDFFLSAQLMEPPESVHLYSEKLVRLPNLGTCFENTSIQVVTPDLSALGIDSQSPILLCAGSPSKYNPNHDQVLVQIAQKLGACQFVFFNFSENLTAILKERLIESFKKANLDANQFLRFIPFLKKEEFHGLMQASDLYLDTIGFSGFNTAMQALASGLPIVAFEGPQMRGRLASSILSRIDLKELVCSSESEYIDLIVKLLQNRELLNSVKIKMNQSKEVLFNDLEPIRELEKFLIEQVQINKVDP